MVFFLLNMWLLFFFFFYFPVLGMEARAVDGHPDNCSAVSPVPIHLVSFNVRTCRLLWYPMRKSDPSGGHRKLLVTHGYHRNVFQG